MTCGEAKRKLAALQADSLLLEEELALRVHLRQCTACRALLWQEDPAVALALALPREGFTDAAFVAQVLAGVRQRRLESQLASRRGPSWRMLAAALVLGLALVAVSHRSGPASGPAGQVAEAQSAEPFVEVEGEGVRVYQLAANAQAQVAFIVSPTLEL